MHIKPEITYSQKKKNPEIIYIYECLNMYFWETYV